MKYRALLTVFLMLVASFAFGQKNPYWKNVKTTKNDKRTIRPWLDKNVRYARAGWYAEPGFTYTLSRFNNEQETVFERNDSTYTATFDPDGRFGIYLGAGRFRIYQKRWLTYIDAGLAWKQLKGRQQVEGELVNTADQEVLLTTTGEARFRENYALAHLNLNKVSTVGFQSFIQNTIGVNVDYRFAQRTTLDGDQIGVQTGQAPGPLNVQLHYKFGWGFKATKRVFVIPSIETPILNAVTFDRFKSTHLYFNSRYRPLIVSVRVMLLRDSNKTKCPPVYGNPDDKSKQDAFNKN